LETNPVASLIPVFGLVPVDKEVEQEPAEPRITVVAQEVLFVQRSLVVESAEQPFDRVRLRGRIADIPEVLFE
jgi:hypothetical protein